MSEMKTEEQMTQDEYNRLYMERTRYFGQGILETGMSVPCPFCVAPDFMVYRVLEAEEAMKKGAACKACGRSMKAIFHVNEPGNQQFEFVQTGGPDCALPFLPPIRRVE